MYTHVYTKKKVPSIFELLPVFFLLKAIIHIPNSVRASCIEYLPRIPARSSIHGSNSVHVVHVTFV